MINSVWVPEYWVCVPIACEYGILSLMCFMQSVMSVSSVALWCDAAFHGVMYSLEMWRVCWCGFWPFAVLYYMCWFWWVCLVQWMVCCAWCYHGDLALYCYSLSVLIAKRLAKWSALRSIRSSGEIIGVHYMDRQHALTRWVLWIGGVSIGIWHLCGRTIFASWCLIKR